MSKTAILVDGGFYRKRASHLWGKHSPEDTADGLVHYWQWVVEGNEAEAAAPAFTGPRNRTYR